MTKILTDEIIPALKEKVSSNKTDPALTNQGAQRANNLPNFVIESLNSTLYSTATQAGIRFNDVNLNDGTRNSGTRVIPNASNTTAGVITAAQFKEFSNKQDKLTIDETPIENSTNPITSGGVYAMFGDIEAILKDINGEPATAEEA